MDRFTCPLELKFVGAESEMSFEGYGAVFGNVDSYGDVIAKNAFKESLREAKKTGIWPSMLSQHGGWGMSADDLNPIGIWTEMEEDDIGLKVAGKLATTPRGLEMHTLMKMAPRPAINGLSIGYRAKEWSVGTRQDEPRRTLKKIDLIEISPVTFPANPKARVQNVKSGMTIRDAEKALREAGFSRTEATALVASGYKALFSQRDSGAGAGDVADSLNRLLTTIKS